MAAPQAAAHERASPGAASAAGSPRAPLRRNRALGCGGAARHPGTAGAAGAQCTLGAVVAGSAFWPHPRGTVPARSLLPERRLPAAAAAPGGMGQKRLGPAGARRGAGSGEAPASTSLPPLVAGPVRCWLRCTVPRVLWSVPRAPAAVLVRLRWWGETSDGTVFQPAARPGQAAGRTRARYAVRCGARQFAAYLTDMAVLVLEVMTRAGQLPVGRVQVPGLCQLSASNPISACFSIVSPTSETLGQLQVSLALEPLPELYDASSSIPTDASLDPPPAQGSSKLQLLAPSQQPWQPAGHPGNQGFGDSSTATSPRRRKEPLLLEGSSGSIKEPFAASPHHQHPPEEPLQGQPREQQVSFSTSTEQESPPRASERLLSLQGPAAKDLLSALVEQGRRLRDAMVLSALSSSPDLQLQQLPPGLEGEAFRASARSPKSFSSSLLPAADAANLFPSQLPAPQPDLSSEDRAIELLLGSSDLSPVHFWGQPSSLLESLSLGSEVYESELNDPHYDQSLLESLFYSAPSDSSLSDFLSEEDENCPKKGSRREGLQRAEPALPQEHSEQQQQVAEVQSSTSVPAEDQAGAAPGGSLGAERLAALRGAHLARVSVQSLQIPARSCQRAPGQGGKPPRAAALSKSTFFVEFHFPVGASRDGRGEVSLSTEVVRVASREVTADEVKFQQRFVLPVRFGGALIDHWWSSELAFEVCMRRSSQKKAAAVGSAALPLRRLLQSERLSLRTELPVRGREGQPRVGPLQVSLELAADSRDLTPSPASCPAPAQPLPAHATPSPQLELQGPEGKSGPGGRHPCLNPPTTEACQEPAAGSRSQQAAQEVLAQPSRAEEEEEEEALLLHLLLLVPHGRDFVGQGSGPHSSCNVYLSCRLLSSGQASRSAVAWGSTQPAFSFCQVMPFSLTSRLLERLKNNVLVLEAWNKLGSPNSDRLLGLVKLPLHQFYISFKDPKVAQLLLQAQYPVVAVDSYMPVVDVFTGSRSGSLKVLLAMGSAQQILALQRLKAEEGNVPAVPQCSNHSLQPAPLEPSMSEAAGEGVMLEHLFEIHVESMKGLSALQSTVWGEADCYVQYHFPVQGPVPGPLQGAEWPEDGVQLKPFCTATTLCVPDPIFHAEHHHSFLLPAAVPVQKLLVTAFMAPGGAGGGIQFEVWCRYYYPELREQLVARGSLPLSRLCAMVTKQHREDVGMQTFSLPLLPSTEASEGFHLRPSGLLDVSVRYQRCRRGGAGTSRGQAVVLCVQIHRAAGLQAAARAVCQQGAAVQGLAEAGLSAYVCVQLPFLPGAGRRRTPAVPGTFCPQFGHLLRFPCRLVSLGRGGEAASLGELLHSASITFCLYHQGSPAAPEAARDYLLGTVAVPTRDLLRRSSGISGWFPLALPEDVMPSSLVQAIVGGLEVSVTFAHPGDRGRVLEAARLLGWSQESLEEPMGDSEEWEQSAQPVVLTISTPRLWLPVHCVLLAGQKSLDPDSCCYLRYKLYDQAATWTSPERPRRSKDTEKVTVSFKKPKKVTLRRSPGLLWFLREEKLEIQVWWSWGRGGGGERPLGTDRLLGSAYVDLSTLAGRSWTAQSVSGLYPLFRSDAADLAGAALRVHVLLAAPSAPLPARARQQLQDSSSGDEGTEEGPGGIQQEVSEGERSLRSSQLGGSKAPGGDLGFPESSFAASVLVERAMHLSLAGTPLTRREVAAPSSCVSFPVADAAAPLSSTPVVANTDCPFWGFQQQARLPKELLLDPQQTLVFKVWHKAESERVIGFASVDLSPLLSGFQLVCGWYNILDFGGQCRGQLKVAVSPLQDITHLKGERQARIRPQTALVRSSFPLLPRPAPSSSKQMGTTLAREVSAPTPEWQGSPAGPRRHQEHLHRVRSFHQGLRQAAGSARGAARVGDSSSSPSSSSRAALLTALRQNLSELDEVQRYLRQKLSRSLPDFTSRPQCEEQSSDQQGLGSKAADPKGSHLVEGSSQLLCQASSLSRDLQSITHSSQEPPAGHQGSGRPLGATHLPRQEAEDAGAELPAGGLEVATGSPGSHSPQPPCSGGSVFERHMLQGLLEQAVPGEEGSGQEDEGLSAAQPPSEEEYEEDIIEPRALNEVSPVTDRSSPWSSLLSELEPAAEHPLGPAGQPSAAGDGCQRGSSRRTFASLPQGAPQSLLPSLGLQAGQSSPWLVAESCQSCSSAAEGAEEELLLPAPCSQLRPRAAAAPEGGSCPGDGALLTQPGKQKEPAGDLHRGASNPSTVQREEEQQQAVSEGAQEEEEGGSELSARSVSAQAGSEGSGESFAGGSDGEGLEEAEELSSPRRVLSDPVVPNFFLPPQEMEASMRLLSISSQPPPAPKGRRGAVPRGIPYRRPQQPRPAAELSAEEAQRIERIFSAPLCQQP
ncbi:C2 domain-containing protein 3-like [Pogoniulus pusillus]|uniref:C2 domain-containing protein 3-like n=1 Tax=Pogoniulus pusillus TaxID=488313 RepID=UPI0030B95220